MCNFLIILYVQSVPTRKSKTAHPSQLHPRTLQHTKSLETALSDDHEYTYVDPHVNSSPTVPRPRPPRPPPPRRPYSSSPNKPAIPQRTITPSAEPVKKLIPLGKSDSVPVAVNPTPKERKLWRKGKQ